jgi:hypothetical protein
MVFECAHQKGIGSRRLMKHKTELATPRIQLRWMPSTLRREYKWECHYEIVILLGEFDIRREVYDEDGEMKKKKLPRELVIQIKGPSLRGGQTTPCGEVGGERYADTPFRDGAHAMWDALQLGEPPIFVIAPDGMAFPVEYDAISLREKARTP